MGKTLAEKVWQDHVVYMAKMGPPTSFTLICTCATK